MNVVTESVITGSVKERIDQWIARYPEDQKQSAVMASLRIVQETQGGYLTPELMDQVAAYLDMPPAAVYEVATFYSNYEHQPVGKHKICVCNSVSCMLRGSEEILAHLENKFDIKSGEVSHDGRFSIKKVECLGACGGAPMMQIGKTYYENLTESSVDKILDGLE
ncbi:MAG: NADH-quinone oxidoreductase subunit NuoE [Piscirickettsiaceae bacterium CG_4_9_14_3_um_filter_43_564]|nr:NADH-quinone oxidoreductase subunit NuoE [Thiomicrospira sp.]OIP94652.1 MAG: NAD(P)H-dependent oxidoreductase subunit E [Thiomicrospira sp. CG2_30_44_34]PIQ03517.1 MAG: NADH-quinone oxidoreductase subunit NuoE [Piscirickettsiaceae bacterium CG18_big_fil_WC_8_21_14_2_50_44_103]PIU38037.1 MAG: NADH-quinone oxidoreductase subunit NuoE [Piscirickettsiaceae bacterium CG07_land_8_20_14_0_80_44_28]PIW56610.1 MAG: NADH-quinone oxidoreductase subunit NuoE [Piscirickettsiaceae bacterium CG12_big_fil_r